MSPLQLTDPQFSLATIGVLVERLIALQVAAGKEPVVRIQQSDYDAIAYRVLQEGNDIVTGDVLLKMEETGELPQ